MVQILFICVQRKQSFKNADIPGGIVPVYMEGTEVPLFVLDGFGDFFKISSWLLAFIMVAKSMTKTFVLTEIIFSATFIALGYLFIHINGTIGLTQAYMANYLFYLLCMIVLFRKTFYANLPNQGTELQH